MDKIYKLYDNAYKQMLGNEEIFKELIETFVKLDWVKNIDFTKIEKIDKSFISEEYLNKESDIIYKVKLIDEKEIYIYFLLEFQSSVDKFMPIRCLNYITNLYLEMIKAKGESIDLPPIFPLVLYNGDDKWNHSNKASKFIKNNDILGRYGIKFDVFILKQNDYSLKDLQKIGNLVSTLFITEVHYESNLIFKEVQKILDKYGITIPVKLFLNYFKKMSMNEKVDIIDYSELEKMYKTKEEVNSVLLTAIKKEKEEFFKKGEAIGTQKGKVEGQLEEKINNIIKLTVKKLGVIPINLEKKIKSCSNIEKLDKIMDNIFDITSFDEIEKILE